MRIGLVGLPGSGKTAVFGALTGLAPEAAGRRATQLGTVKVPDERVDALARIFKPKKTVYAEIVFTDAPAPVGGGERKSLDAAALTAMRDLDALCHVVRAFPDPLGGEAADPVRDVGEFALELVLADLGLIDKRLERLRKEKGKPGEISALEQMKAHLEAERSLSELELATGDWSMFSGFQFLTRKPRLVVLNVAEPDAARPPPPELERACAERGLGLVCLSAQVEMEIAQLPEAEQADFVASLGLAQPARARFIRAAYALLDLISFLTSGPDECRAWPIRRGTHAQRAAGKVHSDIERGFIRAEVIDWKDLVELGSESRCREAGKLRVEGKEYVVQDGDVINYRFNV